MTELKKSGPKDVFLHVLAFGALYASIIALINLVFQYINFAFPDALYFYEAGILNSIRTSTSVLIVIFPVFLILSHILEKEFVKDPAKREFKFRKWLIYLTLFLAAVTVIIDLIILVNSFYGGELTIRFFLKTFAVLDIAGGTFMYYKWDLGREGKSPKTKKAAWTASIIILIAIVSGFFIVGSPAEQRSKRLDENRINNLSAIQSQIVNFWVNKDRLPNSLDELEDDILGFTIPVDPETEAEYEYQVLGNLTFELCGEFASESTINPRSPNFAVPLGRGIVSKQDNWSHDAGRVCFERTIDPELFKEIR